MKTKKFLWAAAAATALASCSDDLGLQVQSEGGLDAYGKLVKAGMLSMGRDNGGDETRAFTNKGGFVWMPSEVDEEGNVLNESNAKIGLCWTGVNDIKGHEEYGAITTPTPNVYTNYEFYHVGWLEPNQVGPEYEDCEDKLKNGAFLMGLGGQPKADFDWSGWTGDTRRVTKYQTAADITKGSYADHTKTLNLGKGVFATDNASVYEGQYLAYFPYNDKFTKGPIVAAVPNKFTIDKGDDLYAASSKSAFCVGLVEQYAGGNVASGLSSHNFSGWYQVKVNYSDSKSGSYNIQKVVLYSETQGIIYEAPLNAQSLVADLKPWKGSFSGDNYSKEKPATTNSVFINTKDDESDYWTVGYSQGGMTVAIPVLPQEISDLQIILINDEDKSATFPAQDKKVFSGGIAKTNITLDHNNPFLKTYMVVDEPSLHSAFDKIYADSDNEGEYTIQLLRSIELEEDYILNYNKNIKIMSKCGATLTMLSTKTNATEVIVNPKTDGRTLTVDVPFYIQGWECCGHDAAKLSIGGLNGDKTTETKPHVVFTDNAPITNDGTLALGNSDKKSYIKINKIQNQAYAVNKAGDRTARANGVYKANEAKLYFMGTKDSYIEIVTVDNYGEVYASAITLDAEKIQSSAAQDAVHDVTTKLKNARTTLHDSGDGESDSDTRVVKANIGTLNNYKEVYIDKQTFVTVKTSFKNENKSGVAKKPTTQVIVDGEGYSDNTDGRLDVNGGTAISDGIIDNSGVVNFTRTNLVNDGLFIDQLSGQVGGQYVKNATGTGEFVYGTMTYKTDLSKGIYVSKVATKERFEFAMTDDVEWKSVTIIEILAQEGTEYKLDEYKGLKNKEHAYTALKNIDIYVNANGVVFENSNNCSNTNVKPAVNQNIGHCITVLDGKDLTIKATTGSLDSYNTTNDVVVEGTAANTTLNVNGVTTIGHDLNLLAANATANTSAKLTVTNDIKNTKGTMTANKVLNVGHDVWTSGTVTTNDVATVGNDLSVQATGTYSGNANYTIGRNVRTAGTYTSGAGAENNLVKGNFAQNGGKVTFAPKTTTKIEGQFSCKEGTFQRLGLNGGSSYRATVNCGSLGETTGTTTSAWPTVMK